VFLHWGKEYSAVPSKVQTELAEFIFEKGADIVIGSHPHTLQKMVWTKYSNQAKGRVAVYSLGNFISNHQKRKTNGGAIARIEIRRTGSKVSIYAADYYLTWVYSPVERLRKKFYIIPCSEYENRSSFFSEPVYYKKMKEFMVDSRSLLYNQNIDFYENIFNGSSWLSNY
jgi:poly-gamma-glutamate synthesis protein (capsule biosynthesis protein)